MISVAAPALAAAMAAIEPETPPPATTTSYFRIIAPPFPLLS
jgi:hypothetical protein